MDNEEHAEMQATLAKQMYPRANATAELVDLARNVAGMDDRLLLSADVHLLRATLREFREQARALMDKNSGR